MVGQHKEEDNDMEDYDTKNYNICEEKGQG